MPDALPFRSGSQFGVTVADSSVAKTRRLARPVPNHDDPRQLQVPHRIFSHGNVHLVHVTCSIRQPDSVNKRHQEFPQLTNQFQVQAATSDQEPPFSGTVYLTRLAGIQVTMVRGDETPLLHKKASGSAMSPDRPTRRRGNHEKRNAHQRPPTGGKSHRHH